MTCSTAKTCFSGGITAAAFLRRDSDGALKCAATKALLIRGAAGAVIDALRADE
jgi:hypothetical protein